MKTLKSKQSSKVFELFGKENFENWSFSQPKKELKDSENL